MNARFWSMQVADAAPAPDHKGKFASDCFS